ncbi:MAG: purine-nucleoside phosphorylase [Austwickia sp.]|nr:purine-nucleoside phosphorylase [Austwickia sp.]MBK8437835.1 purine-nucleoside phosphorylase [Austwickia sp.]
MATPHIRAEVGHIAPAVLFPGDPKRAERIAQLLMNDAELVTDVRGILGFTGTCQGKPLSVIASGMGMPSATIYATELFQVYGVERIVRVGTCGGIAPHVAVGDVIVALGAHTDSNMNAQRLPGIHFAPVASYPLVAAAVGAVQPGQPVHVGVVITRDHFYLPSPVNIATLAEYGVLGVEMEAAGIYAAAAQFGKEALAIMTVSDHLLDSSSDMSPKDRETRFQDSLALAVAAALA